MTIPATTSADDRFRRVDAVFDAALDLPTAEQAAYVVTRSLGQGGMGQVFLGERDDGLFEQRVALKLIRASSPGLVRRFMEERRILALLEHPHIARLVDGGITADGMPYFAMEFVDGEPIDQYCQARKLSIDERLALFESVCDAVGYTASTSASLTPYALLYVS